MAACGGGTVEAASRRTSLALFGVVSRLDRRIPGRCVSISRSSPIARQGHITRHEHNERGEHESPTSRLAEGTRCDHLIRVAPQRSDSAAHSNAICKSQAATRVMRLHGQQTCVLPGGSSCGQRNRTGTATKRDPRSSRGACGNGWHRQQPGHGWSHAVCSMECRVNTPAARHRGQEQVGVSVQAGITGNEVIPVKIVNGLLGPRSHVRAGAPIQPLAAPTPPRSLPVCGVAARTAALPWWMPGRGGGTGDRGEEGVVLSHGFCAAVDTQQRDEFTAVVVVHDCHTRRPPLQGVGKEEEVLRGRASPCTPLRTTGRAFTPYTR